MSSFFSEEIQLLYFVTLVQLLKYSSIQLITVGLKTIFLASLKSVTTYQSSQMHGGSPKIRHQ